MHDNLDQEVGIKGGVMNVPLIVFDKFYRDPDGIREFALSLDYKTEGHYPGTRTVPLNEIDQNLFEDMSLSRAGFLLYELQKKTSEGWKEVRQDDDNDINPLSIPIILDYAEKYLITYCRKIAWATKNKPKITGGGNYPVRTYAWKTNHYSQEFNGMSRLGNDMQEVARQLEFFIEGKSQLLVNDIPEFGEVLDRGEW